MLALNPDDLLFVESTRTHASVFLCDGLQLIFVPPFESRPSAAVFLVHARHRFDNNRHNELTGVNSFNARLRSGMILHLYLLEHPIDVILRSVGLVVAKVGRFSGRRSRWKRHTRTEPTHSRVARKSSGRDASIDLRGCGLWLLFNGEKLIFMIVAARFVRILLSAS